MSHESPTPPPCARSRGSFSHSLHGWTMAVTLCSKRKLSSTLRDSTLPVSSGLAEERLPRGWSGSLSPLRWAHRVPTLGLWGPMLPALSGPHTPLSLRSVRTTARFPSWQGGSPGWAQVVAIRSCLPLPWPAGLCGHTSAGLWFPGLLLPPLSPCNSPPNFSVDIICDPCTG